MSAPLWCIELAEAFWAKAGTPPRFPRDLRDAVAAVPLSVVDLKGASVAGVRDWFARLGIPLALGEPDRPLRACLVAWRGEGFAFLDSLDDSAERNFSLAHELGHFLRDYLRPREAAARKLGTAVLEVLDGLRPATADERLQAVLRGAIIGPFTHLLRRDDSGRPLSPAERESEAAADRLAFELLAPSEVVGGVADRDGLTERLVCAFGLPLGPAARYAGQLMPDSPRIDPAIARLLKR